MHLRTPPNPVPHVGLKADAVKFLRPVLKDTTVLPIRLLFIVWLLGAFARAETCDPTLAAGAARLTRTLQHNAFKVDRTWWMYKDVLHDFERGVNFAEAVQRLDARGHWIDVGGGIAVPMMQVTKASFSHDDENVTFDAARLATLPRLSVVVLSDNFSDARLTSESGEWLKRFQTFRRAIDPDRFRYHAGRPIESYARPESTFGRADVLTDVVGAGAYSLDLTTVLTRYLEVLRPGGAAFVNGVFERTKIRDCRGHDVSPEAFLTKIRGAVVTPGDVRSIENVPDRRGRLRTFRMIRNDAPIFVPNLRLVDVRPGLPPYRTFGFTDCD